MFGHAYYFLHNIYYMCQVALRFKTVRYFVYLFIYLAAKAF